MMMLLRRLKDILESSTYGNAAINTKLGTPAGASVSADIADVESKVDDLETRLGTPSATTDVATATDRLYIRSVVASLLLWPGLAASVVVTGDAVANTLGAFATVMAASSVATTFYVRSVAITATSGPLAGVLVLYHGATDTEFARVAVSTQGTINLPVSKAISANDQIRAKLATEAGGGQTVSVKIGYHA